MFDHKTVLEFTMGFHDDPYLANRIAAQVLDFHWR